jgi:hypothetical protein
MVLGAVRATPSGVAFCFYVCRCATSSGLRCFYKNTIEINLDGVVLITFAGTLQSVEQVAPLVPALLCYETTAPSRFV